jgi:hypothetical protein
MGKPKSEKHMAKEHAKHAKRRATEDWVEGRITTKQHSAVHKRAEHVLAGKPVRTFKGGAGERQMGKAVF